VGQSDFPYPMPERYDPEGPYRNPGNTIPRPSPTNMPVGAWIGNRGALSNWTANPVEGVLWRTVWASPIFDLRPDLGGLSYTGNNNIRVAAVPIWRAAGQNVAAQLFVQVTNLTTFSGLQVLSIEEAHVCDVSSVATINDPEDITSAFTSKGVSSLFTFSPYGSGYPVRYWRLQLQFDILDNQDGPAPGVAVPQNPVIQAALY